MCSAASALCTKKDKKPIPYVIAVAGGGDFTMLRDKFEEVMKTHPEWFCKEIDGLLSGCEANAIYNGHWKIARGKYKGLPIESNYPRIPNNSTNVGSIMYLIIYYLAEGGCIKILSALFDATTFVELPEGVTNNIFYPLMEEIAKTYTTSSDIMYPTLTLQIGELIRVFSDMYIRYINKYVELVNNHVSTDKVDASMFTQGPDFAEMYKIMEDTEFKYITSILPGELLYSGKGCLRKSLEVMVEVAEKMEHDGIDEAELLRISVTPDNAEKYYALRKAGVLSKDTNEFLIADNIDTYYDILMNQSKEAAINELEKDSKRPMYQ